MYKTIYSQCTSLVPRESYDSCPHPMYFCLFICLFFWRLAFSTMLSRQENRTSFCLFFLLFFEGRESQLFEEESDDNMRLVSLLWSVHVTTRDLSLFCHFFLLEFNGKIIPKKKKSSIQFLVCVMCRCNAREGRRADWEKQERWKKEILAKEEKRKRKREINLSRPNWIVLICRSLRDNFIYNNYN